MSKDDNPKLLIIEPDVWLAEAYQAALTRQDHQVALARSATEALKLCDQLNPDIIITELHLDGYDGLALLHELASYDDTRSVPIIIVSNASPNELPLDEERWKQYGVIDYLYKPQTKPEQLAKVVDRALIRRGVS